MLWIFDIDGTLSNLGHRLHFIQKNPADWTAFFAAADKDEPIWEVITLNRALHAAGQTLVLITGRSEEIRGITEEWLKKYRVHYELRGGLYMRKAGDYREDAVVKSELLDQMLKEHQCMKKIPVQVGGVFEDRQQCVDMFRARGLKVFQVAEGKF